MSEVHQVRVERLLCYSITPINSRMEQSLIVLLEYSAYCDSLGAVLLPPVSVLFSDLQYISILQYINIVNEYRDMICNV